MNFAFPTNHSSFIPPFSPSPHNTVLSLSSTYISPHIFPPSHFPTPLENLTYNTYSTGAAAARARARARATATATTAVAAAAAAATATTAAAVAAEEEQQPT